MFEQQWMMDTAALFVGIASGGLVAAGMFAFVTMIGVVSRLAAGTKTVSRTLLYEDFVVVGAAAGNVLFHYEPYLFSSGAAGVICTVFGFFAGVYVGCLSIALAELLNVVPIVARRVRLTRGLTAFVLTFAAGKLIGAVLDFYF